jgi:hypothetical protein
MPAPPPSGISAVLGYFAGHENRDKEGLLFFTAIFDEFLGGAPRLRVIKQLVVEISHRFAKPSAMALFICSTDTGFRRFGRKIPFNSRTSRFRGRMTTSPSTLI